MNKHLLFLLVLISACNSPGYIGETEKEYITKNRIEKKITYKTVGAKSSIRLNKDGDTTFIYALKNGDTTFIYPLPNKQGKYVSVIKKHHEILNVTYLKTGETNIAYNSIDSDDFSNFISKKQDTTIYVTPMKKIGKNDFIIVHYLFKNKICTRIDTQFIAGEPRYL